MIGAGSSGRRFGYQANMTYYLTKTGIPNQDTIFVSA
jgi:hypothetical protein